MAKVKLLDPSDTKRRLDRYELIGELATGGMATVYLARLAGVGGFQRFVAIKRLHPHLASEEEFIAMFLDEARLASGIHHPHVVPILEVGRSDTGYYLVMEYVEGDTLARIVARALSNGKPVPRSVLLRILLDSLAGLHAAHELADENGKLVELVHRDCSPQNILVGIDGSSRITDFGVARASSRLTITRADRLKGKLAYMSPEQAKGDLGLDRRSDLFGMGVILWEVLAGRRLFKADTEAGTMRRVLIDPIARLSTVMPGIPLHIDAVCARSLERDLLRRFQTAAEMADAIERAGRMSASVNDPGVASPRDVAAYMQSVLGQDIAAQRESVRAWLSQSESSLPAAQSARGQAHDMSGKPAPDEPSWSAVLPPPPPVLALTPPKAGAPPKLAALNTTTPMAGAPPRPALGGAPSTVGVLPKQAALNTTTPMAGAPPRPPRPSSAPGPRSAAQPSTPPAPPAPSRPPMPSSPPVPSRPPMPSSPPVPSRPPMPSSPTSPGAALAGAELHPVAPSDAPARPVVNRPLNRTLVGVGQSPPPARLPPPPAPPPPTSTPMPMPLPADSVDDDSETLLMEGPPEGLVVSSKPAAPAPAEAEPAAPAPAEAEDDETLMLARAGMSELMKAQTVRTVARGGARAPSASSKGAGDSSADEWPDSGDREGFRAMEYLEPTPLFTAHSLQARAQASRVIRLLVVTAAVLIIVVGALAWFKLQKSPSPERDVKPSPSAAISAALSSLPSGALSAAPTSVARAAPLPTAEPSASAASTGAESAPPPDDPSPSASAKPAPRGGTGGRPPAPPPSPRTPPPKPSSAEDLANPYR